MLELDLDLFRKHLLSQDGPEFGVEFGGIEPLLVAAPVSFVRVPVGQLLDSSAAQTGLAIGGGAHMCRQRRAVLIEEVGRQFWQLNRRIGHGREITVGAGGMP